jgi:hypothetical protein
MSLAISARGNVYAAITVAHADPPANLQTHRRRIIYTYVYTYVRVYFTASYIFILRSFERSSAVNQSLRFDMLMFQDTADFGIYNYNLLINKANE